LEVVVAATEIERVLGELRETPYESMKEEQDEITFGKSIIDQQLHILNEMFINFLGKGINGKTGPSTTFSTTTNNCCQLCHTKEYIIDML